MVGLPTFFVVTYLVAWAFFFAGGMTPAAWPRGLLFLLGTFAPGYVALWLTSRESGRGGVTALLRRLVDWQVPARWYAFAAAYIVVIKLTVALVHRVTTGAWPQFGQLNRLVVLPQEHEADGERDVKSPLRPTASGYGERRLHRGMRCKGSDGVSLQG